jgi:predicted outer membrane repeat protein
MYSGKLIGIKLKGSKSMKNRYFLLLLLISTSFGYKPSPRKTPYSAPVNAPVQKIECGTESSPFNTQSPQPFQLSDLSRTDRDVDIPINYHVIYVAGDSIFMNVTVDNQPYEHCSWDIRDYDNNTFLLYPGFGFDYPGHSYSLGGVLPPGNFALFLYDDFGYGGVSATVTTSNGTILASITQGQWGTSTFLDFTAPEGDYVDGLVSDEIIYEQTEVLSDHYNDLGYSFTVGSIDSAVNAGWYYATDSHKFETGQWSNDDQYLAMAQAMTIDVPTSVNFFWTGATLTSGLGVYPWSFDEDDSRHGLFFANYTFPGSDGTFSEGITGVHEVGHYFGLHHTFENGCSNPGDEVDDTPYQSQPNYGCPSNNYSCGSYDDIGNFMDYMDDDCLDHFTDGQVDRIEWALETYRPTLLDGEDYEGPVWHIATTGSDSTGDGSEENPFATIQAGIDAAFDGDTVLVSAGTYVENINYNGKNIAVIGEDRETTIIDGNQNGSVVKFENGEASTAVLRGFTIQNGLVGSSSGGGIGCSDFSSPTLTNVTITNNSAGYHGGGISCSDSDLTLTDVTITGNSVSNSGGGISSDDSNLILENVIISGNTSDDVGGGVMYRFRPITHKCYNNGQFG